MIKLKDSMRLRTARRFAFATAAGVTVTILAGATGRPQYSMVAPTRCDTLRAPAGMKTQTDSVAVLGAVAGFHAALEAGDSVSALRLLEPGVVIMESGGHEALPEYRGHHLPADIEFARAVRSSQCLVQVRLQKPVAWVVSIGETHGTFRDRPVNSANAELMVLHKTGGTWRIAAIHWSSRRMAAENR